MVDPCFFSVPNSSSTRVANDCHDDVYIVLAIIEFVAQLPPPFKLRGHVVLLPPTLVFHPEL
jgi:hypothetical protein